MMQMRTHTCGKLRLSDAGKSVKIVGWMENIREVGNNFAFVILRDFYGTTQVVVESEEMMNILEISTRGSSRAFQQEPQAAHGRNRSGARQDRGAGPLPLQQPSL